MTILPLRTQAAFRHLSLLFFLAATAAAMAPEESVILGTGDHFFRWDGSWGKLADGQDLGNTHGCIAVDAAGLIYVNTDTERAVMIFDATGRHLRSWGAELRGGLHGMTVVQEGEREVLYLAHTARHEILKTTLDGEVLWRAGYPESSGIYKSANQYRPTAVAVAPDGRIFAADGYGKSFIHRYDAEGAYLGSFGGPGREPGKLRTPHGLRIDTRSGEPRLLVCDRENNRLQYFDLDGGHLGVVSGMLRRPCNTSQHGGTLAIADLAGRVTLLDRDDQLIAHLGDNPDPALRAKNGVHRDHWHDGEFLSPHGISFDHEGNLYVQDWNFLGRISKLARVQPLRGSTLPGGGVVVNHLPAATGHAIGSPALAIQADGSYVAAHDITGAGSGNRRTLLFRSSDRGQSWSPLAELDGQFGSSLFVYGGALYLMGTDELYGHCVIRRSGDGGRTWTTPADAGSGLLLADGQYHSSPVPLVESGGRLWRGLEVVEGTGGWPRNLRAFVMSAPTDANLLRGDSWTASQRIGSSAAWLDGACGGWLDGNVVAAADGPPLLVMRVDSRPGGNRAAVLKLSKDGRQIAFDPGKDFVELPGGHNKLTIRWDRLSRHYWSLASVMTRSLEGQDDPSTARSAMFLLSSDDLRSWSIQGEPLRAEFPSHGYLEADWHFERDDIVALIRTAAADPFDGPAGPEQANYLICHRIKGFRE